MVILSPAVNGFFSLCDSWEAATAIINSSTSLEYDLSVQDDPNVGVENDLLATSMDHTKIP